MYCVVRRNINEIMTQKYDSTAVNETVKCTQQNWKVIGESCVNLVAYCTVYLEIVSLGKYVAVRQS